ncbi:MAG: hypothetical protein ABSF03_02640 [Streptosporangiaceae bacterium]|jgi:hypothetical protein
MEDGAEMISTRVTNHVASTGIAGTAIGGGAFRLAWWICLATLVVSLGFALLRFLPRYEK